LGTGLAHPRVKPEITHEVARGGKASDVTDLRHQRRCDDEVDAGDRHQPPDLRRLQRVLGQNLFDDRDLTVDKRDLTQASLHRGLLVKGQALLVKPGAATLAEQPG
jgi:hypothetical protein